MLHWAHHHTIMASLQHVAIALKTMEDKRAFPSSNAAASPASESASSRRLGGAAQKRKANALCASNSSSAPSKRITRDKVLPPHTPFHNGPLTRARQIPSSTASAAVKHPVRAPNSVALHEELNKESEREALEAAIEPQFEAVRSRDPDAHVVPTHCVFFDQNRLRSERAKHCIKSLSLLQAVKYATKHEEGNSRSWFSWINIHPIEKRTLPSFFNDKTKNRTPDTYMEIRNYIMKRFHVNPNVHIELKDLSELNVGDLDSRQEVMEFLDYWGLINFHPFPVTGSAVASTNDDVVAEKNSLLEKLYHFETQQFPPIVRKTSLMTPGVTSDLFPESTVSEELVKLEGPAAEYHCSSCSADCSRRCYHCQKQADFDLCINCFSNGKFGSSMSSSDFILMEPAEVPGVSSGNWTDQETLLLLEALELYKENWNEIAEHVATKSKAECILHFVQMPIEDAFVNCGDDVDASCKGNVDAATIDNDSSVHIDASIDENKTSDSNDTHTQNLPNETAIADDVNKMNVNQETPKPEDDSDKKTCEGTSKSEDDAKVKFGQEAGNNYAFHALEEAFISVGYSIGHEGTSSFAEVGNPVMGLAVFLARLVGSDVAVASAHSSLKSMSENSPSTELSARHCFLLEDPPVGKEPTRSERDYKREENEDDINVQQDKSKSDGNVLSNGDHDTKNKDIDVQVKRQLAFSHDGVLEKPMVNQEGVVHDNCNDPGNSKLPSDHSDSSTSKDKVPPSAKELGEGTLLKVLCQPVIKLKDGCASDTLSSENKLKQSIKSNLAEEHPKLVEKPKAAVKSLDTTDSAMDVDLVSNSLPSEKNESQPNVTLISSQHTLTEKDVGMTSLSTPLDNNELPHPVKSNSGMENEHSTVAGGDPTENGTKVKDGGKKAKRDNNFEKVKQAAVSVLAAAAVKGKILADQEEDRIRQLASLLIEKQLHKLETKLAFFQDLENVMMSVRKYLVQSRQKLFHERARIIAKIRLGLHASSSRGVPRRQIIMNLQRSPLSRPVGATATTLPNHLAPAAAVGNLVWPSTQENLSSVGTK
ncbi:hypothetical protein RJT34_08261 [Clitoria ternatea]|uniref:SWI/SNF complex subunit SWI3D n=1 Tax=Clitoria ternatea TaxID=43366 RepID=A0AAN9PUR5_CLITE